MNTPEREAISIPVQKYIDGIAQHNTDLVAEAFHTNAVMSSHMGNQFTIVPAIETIVNYMNSKPPITETSPNFAGRIISIEQAGIRCVCRPCAIRQRGQTSAG